MKLITNQTDTYRMRQLFRYKVVKRLLNTSLIQATALMMLVSSCQDHVINPPQGPLAKQWDKAITSVNSTVGGAGSLLKIVTSASGDIALGSSEFIYKAGNTLPTLKGFSYVMNKLGADGSHKFYNFYGGNDDDFMWDVVATPDGGFLLGGMSMSPASRDKSEEGRAAYWIIKINADGSKQWDRTFDKEGYDQLGSIIPTADGGFFLVGTNDHTRGLWLIKINANGAKLWDEIINTNIPLYTLPYKTVVPTTDGGFLIGVKSDNSDAVIAKISADGTKLWEKTLAVRNVKNLNSIVNTSDGGFLVGYTSTTNVVSGSEDYLLAKVSGDGTKLWEKTFGGAASDVLSAIVSTADGGFLLGGTSSSDISGDKSENSRGLSDYWLIKISADGIKQWDKTFGGDNKDELITIAPTNDGGFAVGGHSLSKLSGDKSDDAPSDRDYWIVKIK